MQTIEIKTLVDITNTQVIRPNQGTPLEYNQFRNFTTLRQCLEIRSNIFYDVNPVAETVDLKDSEFGSKYKGKHLVWTFRFNPERENAYFENNSIVGALINDINGVPIIEKLTETINMSSAIFDVGDAVNKNTIIKHVTGPV